MLTEQLSYRVMSEDEDFDEDFLNYLGYLEEVVFAGCETINCYHQDKLIASLKYLDDGSINHIYVSPEYRGQGIMRELLTYYPFSSHRVNPADFIDSDLYSKVCQIIES